MAEVSAIHSPRNNSFLPEIPLTWQSTSKPYAPASWSLLFLSSTPTDFHETLFFVGVPPATSSQGCPVQLVMENRHCCPLGCLPLSSPPPSLFGAEAGEQHWQQQKFSTQSNCKTTAENSLALRVQGLSPEAACAETCCLRTGEVQGREESMLSKCFKASPKRPATYMQVYLLLHNPVCP